MGGRPAETPACAAYYLQLQLLVTSISRSTRLQKYCMGVYAVEVMLVQDWNECAVVAPDASQTQSSIKQLVTLAYSNTLSWENKF